ncbi:MAG: restriction endonuclease subunit S [Moraxella sp.]|nr:restriction endonuclease subunit S [Moraxella sp.]
MSEVNFKDIDLGDRFDAEFFSKQSLEIENILKRTNATELRHFGKFVASAFYPSAVELYQYGEMPFIRCVDCVNFPLITSYQENLFEKLPIEFIREQKGINTLYKGDIVITKVGTPCYASMIQDYDEVALSRTVLGMQKISKINPYYLLIFLRSKYGFGQLLRHRELTIQYQLTLERTKKILVYIPEEKFQNRIEKITREYFVAQETARNSYLEAETLLLENLGLQNFQATNQSVNIKALKDSFLQTGRLDAEFYQVKYEQYWNLIKSQDYVFIRDEYLHITQKPDWKNQAYQYIEIGDVNISDGSYQANWVEYQDLPANAKIQVQKGDILISTVRPYRGAVTIIGENDQDLVVSGAFTVLRKKENSIFNNEVLKVLLRSDLYKDWLLQFNVGTSYPVIKDGDILNLPIPKIPPKIQTQIANYVRQSNELREQATQLLAQAKHNVETEIEQNALQERERERETYK